MLFPVSYNYQTYLWLNGWPETAPITYAITSIIIWAIQNMSTGKYEQRWSRSACASAVWSELPLSANRIIGYYGIYNWRAKARIIKCARAWWSEFAFLRIFENTFSLDAAFWHLKFEMLDSFITELRVARLLFFHLFRADRSIHVYFVESDNYFISHKFHSMTYY